MSFDISKCQDICVKCIRSYKKKHKLEKGQPFKIPCTGIPKNYITDEIKQQLSGDDLDTVSSILNPVEWAKRNLDWHCIDPEGEVWKRKNPTEYFNWLRNNPGKSILGHSRYHRPYQFEMLSCTSPQKVLRIGRQSGKSDTLCIAALYNAFTKPGAGPNEQFKILMIAPYQEQVVLLFNRITELLKNNPELQNSVLNYVKSPSHTMTLSNGSIIKGATAATKSGGNADSIRGQSVNVLIWDEADMLSSGDIDTSLATITNNPNATVWMSSTPTGKRDRFYNTCLSREWKEFHYPSYVNPMWNERTEANFRQQLTELGYRHEIEALFSQEEEGVFQNAYIDAAKLDYHYSNMKREPGWIYTLGVDWNDVKNGSTLTVVGFNLTNNVFYVVSRDKIQRAGWNQLEACKRVRDLNRIWRPVCIYIDSGFGSTQWEILRKEGFDALNDRSRGPNHPDSMLRNVRKYEFGSKVETRDLHTQQAVKKPAKPFLVENTVRRFEAGDLKFSKYDEELEKQLLGYIISRINPSGVPVYETRDKAIGDHALDSLLLAMVGFTLEQTPFGRVSHRVDIAFAGNFGEGDIPEEGNFVIHKDRQRMEQDKKQRVKPKMNRTESIIERKVIGSSDLPAYNTSGNDHKPGLWAWPGFGSDQPKPRIKSLSELFNGGNSSSGSKRPRRKNI